MSLLWLAPFFPLLGSLVLTGFGARLGRCTAAWVAALAAGLAALAAFGIAIAFFALPGPDVRTQELWTWMEMTGLRARFGLRLDALSAAMLPVVAAVGFLVHLCESRSPPPETTGHFAALNLLLAALLLLLLASDWPLLFLAWEGVALAAYLLTGLRSRFPAGAGVARQGFILVRTADIGVLIGIFLILNASGSADIQTSLGAVTAKWAPEPAPAALVAGLMLVGSLGLAAQFLLATRLAADPLTPAAGALLQALVLAGPALYLLARLQPLLTLVPGLRWAILGADALAFVASAGAALFTGDLRRLLALSGLGQSGIMLLALAAGNWLPAVVHFGVYAFVQAVLVLAAGTAVQAVGAQGGVPVLSLRRNLPSAFVALSGGGAVLAVLPLVTAALAARESLSWAVWTVGFGASFLASSLYFRLLRRVEIAPPARAGRLREARPPGRALLLRGGSAGVRRAIGSLAQRFRRLGVAQSGRLGWYAAGLAGGVVLFVALGVWQ